MAPWLRLLPLVVQCLDYSATSYLLVKIAATIVVEWLGLAPLVVQWLGLTPLVVSQAQLGTEFVGDWNCPRLACIETT